MPAFLLFLSLLFCHSAWAAEQPAIHKVLVLVAMESEARPLIEQLHLQPVAKPDTGLPMEAYAGQVGSLAVELIWNGKDPAQGVDNLGTQPAVLAAYLGLRQFQPDLILNVGTAGAKPHQSMYQGDVYYSARLYFYGRRFPSAAYKQYAVGGYYSQALPAPTLQDLHLHAA